MIRTVIRPLIRSLNPAADVRSSAEITIDLSGIQIRQRITGEWTGKPVVIWRRSPGAIAAARAAALDEDHNAKEVDGLLIKIGICPHSGCVPFGQEGVNVGEFGGWFCPCHGSRYDTSGRIQKGPAPGNLDVPP